MKLLFFILWIFLFNIFLHFSNFKSVQRFNKYISTLLVLYYFLYTNIINCCYNKLYSIMRSWVKSKSWQSNFSLSVHFFFAKKLFYAKIHNFLNILQHFLQFRHNFSYIFLDVSARLVNCKLVWFNSIIKYI